MGCGSEGDADAGDMAPIEIPIERIRISANQDDLSLADESARVSLEADT